MDIPRIAVGPDKDGTVDVAWARQAVTDAGGLAVSLADPDPDALVWVPGGSIDELGEALARHPGLRWIQLPFAGVERVAAAGLFDSDRSWTCAKGSYAEPVAEHALLLALAGLRRLDERIRATSWGRPDGTSLYGQKVTILGGGGITDELLRLLAPFGVEATVVRRRADPLPGAARTVATAQLDEVLPGALVVFVALALTPETTHIIGARQLELMDRSAWLVNVARGPHVDSDALVAALRAGEIAGAALDVTEPEPLPDGHPLWAEPNCIITPHTADTWDMIKPLLASRIRANVAHFTVGEPLEGLVDPAAGY
ncbi:MAG TPA: D-isomer specific 2-hydroxyacid dehydrogenase family protein [Acidimicrobiales bacterium]|nr:D-isomer specific 2-hydroxyacid dehydrogenase family protein [Acidimicrobiales bacterium]